MINRLCLAPIMNQLIGASFDVGSSTLSVNSLNSDGSVSFTFDSSTNIDFAKDSMYATAYTYAETSGAASGEIVGQKIIPDCTLVRFVNIVGNLCDNTIDLITLKSLSISKAPTKTTYAVGESFNPAGMELEVTYSDDSTEIVPITDIFIDKLTGLTVADTHIKFTYTECGEIVMAVQPITVTV